MCAGSNHGHGGRVRPWARSARGQREGDSLVERRARDVVDLSSFEHIRASIPVVREDVDTEHAVDDAAEGSVLLTSVVVLLMVGRTSWQKTTPSAQHI